MDAEPNKPAGEARTNAAKIARLDSLRRWCLLPAAILLISGIVTSLRPVLAASALPLLVMLILSYRIKHLEKSIKEECQADE
jgi:uncharacterized membrane protein HdeD (DUF308 family)